MPTIAIISASVRRNRNSHRVALYLKQFLEKEKDCTVIILDLAAYNFPVFQERLRLQPSPDKEVVAFAEHIQNADGIIMVTPEYNGGYPASLKNIIDLLYDEWKRKPIAFATVSAGSFGGMNVITSLQYTLWKMQAWTVPAMFPVPHVTSAFDEKGNPSDEEGTNKRARRCIDELWWCIEAVNRMKE